MNSRSFLRRERSETVSTKLIGPKVPGEAANRRVSIRVAVHMLEDVVTPTGPYRLRLMCRSGTWRGALVDGSEAVARQRSDGAS